MSVVRVFTDFLDIVSPTVKECDSYRPSTITELPSYSSPYYYTGKVRNRTLR